MLSAIFDLSLQVYEFRNRYTPVIRGPEFEFERRVNGLIKEVNVSIHASNALQSMVACSMMWTVFRHDHGGCGTNLTCQN